jgi:hypothetical protein
VDVERRLEPFEDDERPVAPPPGVPDRDQERPGDRVLGQRGEAEPGEADRVAARARRVGDLHHEPPIVDLVDRLVDGALTAGGDRRLEEPVAPARVADEHRHGALRTRRKPRYTERSHGGFGRANG